MKNNIKIGSKVQVVSCKWRDEKHIGKIGKVENIFKRSYEVVWEKDGCITSKVRLIKTKKKSKNPKILSFKMVSVNTGKEYTFAKKKVSKKCKISDVFCSTHKRPSYLCGLEYGTASIDLEDSSLQHRLRKIASTPSKKKVSKKDERIYAFPHCGVDGCMECLNEADEEMDRIEKTPTKKQLLHQKYLEAKREYFRVIDKTVRQRLLAQEKYIKAYYRYDDKPVELDVVGMSIHRNRIKAEQNYKKYKDKTKKEEYIDDSHCPICKCLYDDKQKGTQGRNGACECQCGHKSKDKV